MRTAKAQKLLQGQHIIGVDNDCSDVLKLMLKDGRSVEIRASTVYIGNGLTMPQLEVVEASSWINSLSLRKPQ